MYLCSTTAEAAETDRTARIHSGRAALHSDVEPRRARRGKVPTARSSYGPAWLVSEKVRVTLTKGNANATLRGLALVGRQQAPNLRAETLDSPGDVLPLPSLEQFTGDLKGGENRGAAGFDDVAGFEH